MEEKSDQVAVVIVPFPAQGHLNQFLQLSILLSSYNLPVHYVSSAVHNRQATSRINALRREAVAQIHFHHLPTPPFLSPPPDPNSPSKFPSQLQPSWEAMLQLRHPAAALLRELAGKFKRLAIIHDTLTASIIQDAADIDNAETYSFNAVSAFSVISFAHELFQQKPFPFDHPKELPPMEDVTTEGLMYIVSLQTEPASRCSGELYNTSRVIEAKYLEFLEKKHVKEKPCWAIGPLLSTVIPSPNHKHECLEWLDRQEPRSVLYISFGTTVSMSDEQVNELAHWLMQSKVKFLWVLRDADKGDVFDGDVRRVELPEGFEERVGGEGMVVRDWAPQPEILSHRSVGGFMSHCGWNSCLESITMGVAIAGWPMHSDQPRNAALIADVLGTGIVVREWKERLEVVKASRIESVVRRLMESEEIRKRAEELGAAVRRSTELGGASRNELDSFVAHITR